ncbi:MAG: pyridoxamine 5'-phosphate oxidase family protein [Lachnotalea sp.]
MEKIKYTQRICSDQEKIEQFLLKERTGTLSIAGHEYPYAIPINYVWHNGSVFFHGMGTGKKNDLLSKDPNVCFTVYKENGTVMDQVPCHADTSYMSVMIFGKVEKITDPDEGAQALQKLVEKYMPGYYKHSLSGNLIDKYRSSMDGKGVSIYQIKQQHMTAKENVVEPDQIFGETQKPIHSV